LKAAMASNSKGRRSTVLLVGYSDDGRIVERSSVPYDDYYDGKTPIVDSAAYRAARRIRRLTGEIYNASGNRQQTFDNVYDEAGKYLRSRMVFADGTVVEG
jgi:hypothetical protein